MSSKSKRSGEPKIQEQMIKTLLAKPEQAIPATTVARLVGRRLRVRRLECGISQTKLGKMLGVTFQQIQKYERGANSLSTFRLANLARVLRIDFGYLMQDLPQYGRPEAPAAPRVPEQPPEAGWDDLELTNYQLARELQSIQDRKLRLAVVRMIRAAVAFEKQGKGKARR